MMAISAAVSVSSSVSSSSALRKRGLCTVTIADLPCRSTLAGPKSTTPFLIKSATRSIASIFGKNLLVRRRQARHQLPGLVNEIVHPRENAKIFRKLAIDSFGVAAEEILARTAAIGKDEFCRVLLIGRPCRFLRESGEQIGAAAPEFRTGHGITFEVAGHPRLCLDPRRRLGGQSASTKTFGGIPSNDFARLR